jgi:hypothetical protein
VTPAGRALRAAAAAAVLVGATAGPAAAHVIGGGAEPINYRTGVRGIEPAVPGLEARTVAPGDRLELVNGTGQEVLVLGYRLEPYLRVGPDGAFENRRSPSAYANRFATAPASIPAEFDAAAAPQWRRIGDRPRVAWRDHRARWSGPDPQAVTARGPRRPRVLAAVALLAVAADAVHTAGALLASDAPLSAELNGTVTTVAGWAVSGLAAWRLLRGRAESAAVFLLLGGVLLTLAGALPDLTALARSQLPTAVGPAVTRAAIAVTLGLGTAMVVAGLLGFRSEPPLAPPPDTA